MSLLTALQALLRELGMNTHGDSNHCALCRSGGGKKVLAEIKNTTMEAMLIRLMESGDYKDPALVAEAMETWAGDMKRVESSLFDHEV